MLPWRKQYYKNYRTGVIVSLFVHVTIIGALFVFIPKTSKEKKNYFRYNEYSTETSSIDFDYSQAIKKYLESGGSQGGGNNPDAVATTDKQTLFGNLVPSPEPSKIDFSSTTNLNPIDTLNKQTEGFGDGIGSGTGDGTGKGIGNDGAYSSLPFVPRQILEVLPEQDDINKGTVILALKIGKDGRVIEHMLLMNSTKKDEVLKKVLAAAYKSKWQTVKMEGNKVEYWIEKTYSFN